MNWQGFQLTKCFSAKVRNPIKTALLTSDVPAPKLSRFVRTAYEGGFTVDYSITKDLIWKGEKREKERKKSRVRK
jgi:hypothetical protein